MERFTKTKFILSLKENKNIQPSSLNCEYDEFTCLLFAGNAAMNKMEYHNALVYTGVELENLIVASKKKYNKVSSKSHCHC
jgi:predicted nucleic-acid-binding Zn-ribbon protein